MNWRKRLVHKANKYEQILQAAAHVFLEKGFEKATVKDIAVEAKVGKGTIYEYFSGKENLFIEMIKNGVRYVYNDIYTIFDQGASMEETKETFLQNALQLINEQGDKLRILYEDSSKRLSWELEKWIIEKNDWLISKVAENLQEFMEKGQIRAVDPQILAGMILHSIQIGFYYKVVKEEEDIENVLRSQMDIIFFGIGT
ncbi:TetR/AcrR family transcriptional regulator [Oceanobacillus senegalensis]|uniref:TetR/AcrR family transcriptional regulator n=1 Tax=Oceanobacillus senegalensis TaxID=1936063 RepID=UPI000A310805|nr:TetR/AcrR family transcriptional regulator [Oceanobacillus senegalensis]